MRRERWRIIAVLITAVLLSFASTHDSGDDDDDEDDSDVIPQVQRVVAFSVETPDREIETLVADAAGGRDVSTSFTVSLLGCRSTISQSQPGDLHYHDSCVASTQLMSSSPEGLTASGTLIVTAERIVGTGDGSGTPRRLENLRTIPIGPLAFGESVETGPISHRFPAEDPPLSRDVDSGEESLFRYQIAARVTDCRLSNGSACGNGASSYRLNVLPAAPEPAAGDSGSETYRGAFTVLAPVPAARSAARARVAGVVLKTPNRIELVRSSDGERFSGTFELVWALGDVEFTTTGTIEGTAVSSTRLVGEYVLDAPGASYLAFALVPSTSSGSGQLTVGIFPGDIMMGELHGEEFVLRFELELSP